MHNLEEDLACYRMSLKLDIEVEEWTSNHNSDLDIPAEWYKPVIPENYNENVNQGVEKEIDEQSAKLILLLNLIDEYERNLVDVCDKLEAGFLQLSRAKFHNPNRFDSSYYDFRELNAQSQIKDGKLFVRTSKTEAQFEEKEVKDEGDDEEKEGESTLRNRHRKISERVEKMGEKLEEKLEQSSFKDPIKMFGAILPASLYEAQTSFRQSLGLLMEKKRLMAEMSVLFDRIEEIELEKENVKSEDKKDIETENSCDKSQ